MAFENLILGLEFLNEEPVFTSRILTDTNPLTKRRKKRFIEMPNETMRIIHRRLVDYLRSLPVKYQFATGCLPGCSPLKNIERHRTNQFFYLLDLKSAYRHVSAQKLAAAICRADGSLYEKRKEVRTFLERYCMSLMGGLATGAPASPDLFNLYCLFLLDNRLVSLLKKYNLTYTRYLDDLAFSSKAPISRTQRQQIRSIIEEAGFLTNHLKSEVRDLKKGPAFINGIGLEKGGRVFVPREYTIFLRGLIHKGILGHIGLWPHIEGAMGVFFGITDRNRLNLTEKTVVREYKKFRSFLGKKGAPIP